MLYKESGEFDYEADRGCPVKGHPLCVIKDLLEIHGAVAVLVQALLDTITGIQETADGSIVVQRVDDVAQCICSCHS